jgi:hypothetical protein
MVANIPRINLLVFWAEDMRQQVPPNGWLPTTKLQGVITQEITILIYLKHVSLVITSLHSKLDFNNTFADHDVIQNKRGYVIFEVFTAVTMKNAVFWDVAPCRSRANRRFVGTHRLHLQGRKIFKRGTSVSLWLQTEPPVENTQLYMNREEGRVGHMGNQYTGEG